MKRKMADIGDVKRGTEIGRKDPRYHMYLACIECGKPRWVELRKGIPHYARCHKCAMKHRKHSGVNNPNWNGGKTISAGGYVHVRIYPNSPMYLMAHRNGYVLQSRLVVAQHLVELGLEPKEVIGILKGKLIHHRNEDTTDDRLENLQIRKPSQHLKYHMRKRRRR